MALRLLVVDDDEIMAELAVMLATDAGFSTATATGERVIDVCAQFNPNVVLLDMLMPGVDGFAIIRSLRELEYSPRIILLCSDERCLRMAQSLTGDELAIEAIFVKPFEPALLSSKLHSLNHALSREVA